jgi:glucuronokinase
LPAWQIEMVETARGCGASAKFAGPGGDIVGTYDTDDTFKSVSHRLAAIGSRTITPDVGAVRL